MSEVTEKYAGEIGAILKDLTEMQERIWSDYKATPKGRPECIENVGALWSKVDDVIDDLAEAGKLCR